MFKNGLDIIETIENYTKDKKIRDLIITVVEFYEKKIENLKKRIRTEKHKIKLVENENKENLEFLKFENEEKMKKMINYITEKDLEKIKKLSEENYSCKIENKKELNLIKNLNQNLDKTFFYLKEQTEQINDLKKQNKNLKKKNNFFYEQNKKKKQNFIINQIENFETKSLFRRQELKNLKSELDFDLEKTIKNKRNLKKKNFSLEKKKKKHDKTDSILFQSYLNSRLAKEKFNDNINLSLENPFLYMKKKKDHLNKKKFDLHEMKKLLEFLEQKEKRILSRILKFPVSNIKSINKKKVLLERELIKLDDDIDYIKKVIGYHDK